MQALCEAVLGTGEPSSFRDRQSRVFHADGRILRGLSPRALNAWQALSVSELFRRFVADDRLVATRQVEAADGWAAVLEHEPIPFVSYPYEWCFGMLRDAALLHLDLLDAALDEGMVLQDASAFNVQWRGAQPVFIDVPSIVPLAPGQPWAGYRQFCEMFLYPLLLQAYRDVPFQPWLRGSLEGIPAEVCRRLMTWRDLLRPGVVFDVCLQARLQARHAGTERDIRGELRSAGFDKNLIRRNVRRLGSIVRRLKWQPAPSAWSEYTAHGVYIAEDEDRKRHFVASVIESRPWNLVWDLGCNTGRFARLAAQSAGYVVGLDSDHAAVERFYLELKAKGCRNILPLVGNFADPSPNRGWRGLERKALPERGRPDLVLCLALLHHLVLGAGLPVREVVDWLADLGGSLVIEFVTRDDPMARRLLLHKDEAYADYSLTFFERCLGKRFTVARREPLGSGTRTLYFCLPRQ
jgi:SAM-dependent methyltransferase